MIFNKDYTEKELKQMIKDDKYREESRETESDEGFDNGDEEE